VKPQAAPAATCAVIVGVEQSKVFADDPLLGPVADAIAWFEWLAARGVPAANMVLFAAPKPRSEALLQDWSQRHGGARHRAPDQEAFVSFIADELPALGPAAGPCALFIIWIGHGQIDQRQASRTRRLFFANATSTHAYNLGPVEFLKALRSPRHARFAEQLMIVDACANDSVGLGRDGRLLQPADFGGAGAAAGTRQYVMMATAPGEVAQRTLIDPTSRQSVAQFSDKLMRAADAAPAGAWPDFKVAFLSAQHEFENSNQTPVDWCLGMPDDQLSDSGRIVLPEAAATRLVAWLGAVDADTLREAFHAAGPPGEPTPDQLDAARAGLAAMAALICETARQPDAPPPLCCWALQVLLRLPGETQRAGLRVWLQGDGRRLAEGDADLVRYELAAQARLQKPESALCFVLITEQDGARLGTSELLGWLFCGTPAQVLVLGDGGQAPVVQADGSGRAAALQALLDAALDEAFARGIPAPQLVVEMALPKARLDDDIEALPVAAEGGLPLPLGTMYSVVRRLRDRLSVLAQRRRLSTGAQAWKDSGAQLSRRLDTNGLRLQWMTPQELQTQGLGAMLNPAALACCVGLAREHPGCSLDELARSVIEARGLPFACWSDDAWTAADTARLEADLAGCRGPVTLKALFDLKAQAGFRDHPSARLRWLWDDPAHNPYVLNLKAGEP